MNVPNILTLCRFFLIPIYIVVFVNDQLYLAFAVLLLAGLSDILDGYIARRTKQVTQIGVMLDPLADKLMMMVVFVSLVLIKFIPWTAAIAMLIREVGMITFSSITYLRGKEPIPANILGKLTTVLYFLAIFLIIIKFQFAVAALWFVIVLSYIASIVYFSQYRAANHKSTP